MVAVVLTLILFSKGQLVHNILYSPVGSVPGVDAVHSRSTLSDVIDVVLMLVGLPGGSVLSI